MEQVIDWVTMARRQHCNGHLAQIQDHTGGRRFPEHTHRGFCEIVYGLEGQISHVINGRRVLHEAGMAILVRESDRHSLRGTDFDFVNLAFPVSHLTLFESLWALPGVFAPLLDVDEPPTVTIPPERRRSFHASIRSFFQPPPPPPGSPRHASGRLVLHRYAPVDIASVRFGFVEFLSRLLWFEFLSPGALTVPTRRLPEWLDTALKWIQDVPVDALTVKDLVAGCHRCPEHVSRAFRKHLGRTPSQYLNDRKLTAAADLLAYTASSIPEVAERTGYNSLSYFHRLFHRMFGCSPGAYRRRHLRLVLPASE